MPDKSKYDLHYRPQDYFETVDPATELISRINGQVRRRLVKEHIEAGVVHEIHPAVLRDALDGDECDIIGRIHPFFMGGEYLPQLSEGEIEIARVSLNSVTGDVISLRAVPDGGGFSYSVVDEYWDLGHPAVIYRMPFERSELPLTLGELITLIDGTEHIDAWTQDVAAVSLATGFRDLMPEWDDLEGLAFFATVSSEFYPQLETYYNEAAREWLAAALAERDEDDEDESTTGGAQLVTIECDRIVGGGPKAVVRKPRGSCRWKA